MTLIVPGSAQTSGGNIRKSYTYSRSGVRELVTDRNGTGYYYYDGRGSVSKEIKEGRTEHRQRYDAYGNMTSGAYGQDRVYGYNGEEYDPRTGLIYLNARNYDPQTGRFTARDRYLGSSTDLLSNNRYIYCENDPVNYCDPSGYKNTTVTHGALAGNTGSSGTKKSTSSSKSSSSKSSTITHGALVGNTGSSGSSTTVTYGALAGNSYSSGSSTSSSSSSGSSSSTSLTQNRYNATRGSYWNTDSNFQGNWWHDENKLQNLYDILLMEARENGGALDLNDIMMNRNKMLTLQAMMHVYPKSGYYDEAMEHKLNVIGVQNGWHYDAGTGQLTIEMLDDIQQHYDNYPEWSKNLGKFYENGGAEFVQGVMDCSTSAAITVISNYTGNTVDSQSSGNAEQSAENTTNGYEDSSDISSNSSSSTESINRTVESIRNSPDQNAVLEISKEVKMKGGVSAEDANTIMGWAEEYNVPYHGPERHPTRAQGTSQNWHFHVGTGSKTGHIPIR